MLPMAENNTSLESKCGSGSIRKKLRSAVRLCPQSPTFCTMLPFLSLLQECCTQKVGAGAPVSVSFKQSIAGDSPGPSCSEMFNFARELLTGLGGLAAARPCPSQPLLFSLPLFPGALWNALDRRVDHKGTIGLLGQLCLARRLGYAGSTQK